MTNELYPQDPAALTFQNWRDQCHDELNTGLPESLMEAWRARVQRYMAQHVHVEILDEQFDEYYSMMDEFPGEPESVPSEMPEVGTETETETGIEVVLPLT